LEPATDIDAKIAAVKEILMFQVVHKQLKIQDFTFKAFDTLDKMNLDTKRGVKSGENLMGRQARTP
jgi:hypothetical protein